MYYNSIYKIRGALLGRRGGPIWAPLGSVWALGWARVGSWGTPFVPGPPFLGPLGVRGGFGRCLWVAPTESSERLPLMILLGPSRGALLGRRGGPIGAPLGSGELRMLSCKAFSTPELFRGPSNVTPNPILCHRIGPGAHKMEPGPPKMEPGTPQSSQQ